MCVCEGMDGEAIERCAYFLSLSTDGHGSAKLLHKRMRTSSCILSCKYCFCCRYFRPSEVDNLRGSAEKARKVLGWKPKVGFKQLVAMMVSGDLDRAKREKVLVDNGYIDSHQQP